MPPTELSEMIALAERVIRLNEPAVLATLFSASGSTYRPLGAMMVSALPTMIAGGVSGGCLEQYIARMGRALTETQSAALLNFDTDPDNDDGRPILGCGGALEVLVERLVPAHVEFLRRLKTASESDACSTAACVVDATIPSAITVTRSWLEDDGTACIDPPLESLRDQAISAAQSRYSTLDSTRRALMYFVPSRTRLVIVGAGDDARPLCSLAHSLGWHVTVMDKRPRSATPDRFPEADEVIADDWQSALSAACFTARTAVVIMTHSVLDDVAVLPHLADKLAFYIGVLGPDRRRAWLTKEVASSYPCMDEFVSRVRGPIGLNLGDRSQAGIAVSVMAEIMACLHQRDAKPLSGRDLTRQDGACATRDMSRA